jgi:Phospholipase B
MFSTLRCRLALALSIIFASTFLLTAMSHKSSASSQSQATLDVLSRASRSERNGWIYIHLEGTPEEVGYQHGYLLAREIGEALRVLKTYLKRVTGKDWQFYRNAAREMFWDNLDDEYKKEIEGIARGAYARAIKVDRDDILALNGWIEIAWYYVPSLKQARLDDPELHQTPPPACSAFIATGSWTKDGQIVIGHNNWSDYLIGRHWNIMVDLKPAKGNRILMDSFPGFIHSGDDFYVTGAGLMITETTISQFKGFDPEGLPEFYRIRKATQYADSIDDWLKVMMDRPNGGYANDWLIGDRKTGEIARLENGLKNNIVERTKDGYYIGSNFPVHEKTRVEETTFDNTKLANTANARRKRWEELMEKNRGRIDVELGKKLESDHYDVVRKKSKGSSFTLCGHVEADELGAPEWDWKSFYPGGTVNAKVTDGTLAAQMKLWGSVGRPCGEGFKLDRFLKAHPEYEWTREISGDMPSGAWTLFSMTSRADGESVRINTNPYEDDQRRDPTRRPNSPGNPAPPLPSEKRPPVTIPNDPRRPPQ